MIDVRAWIIWSVAITACSSETLPLDPGPLADAGIDPQTGDVCGDGRVTGQELCERGAIGDTTCEDFGFYGGELRCAPSCAGFFVEGCTGIPGWANAVGEPCLCGPAEICVPNAGSNLCVPVCYPGELQTPIIRDVYRVRVHGRVTSNGMQLPAADNLGKIYFSGLSTVEVALQPAAGGAYDALVPPGKYRVHYRGGDGESLPDQAITLIEETAIEAETELNLDLPPSSNVQLDFTVHGGEQIWWNATATLSRLEDPLSEPLVIASLLETASRPHRLAHGTYEVRVASAELFAWYFDQVVATLDVERDMRQDVDIPAADLILRVRVNGAALDPNEHRAKASIDALPLDGGNSSSFYLRVPPARYTLITGIDHQRLGGRAAADDHRVIDLGADLEVVVDFAAPRVRARGTISGAPDYAMLRFESTEGDFVRFASVLPGDPQTFDVELYPATYRVRFEQSDLLTVPDEAVIDRDVELAFETTNVPPPDPRVELRGALTINGEPIRDNTLSGPRGHLHFRRLDGIGDHSAEIPGTGPAEYAVRLERGAYEIAYEAPWGGDGINSSKQDAIPPHRYVLRPRLEVSGDARRDFDFKTVLIEGSINTDAKIVLSRYAGSPDSYYEDHREYRTVTERAQHFRFDAFPGPQRLWIERVADAEFYPGALERRLRVDTPSNQTYMFEMIDLEATVDFEGGAWPGDRPAGLSVFGAGGSAYRALDANNTARLRVPRFMSGVAVEGFLIGEPCARSD